MQLFLIDLDDTLVNTRTHAISALYPAVANALDICAPDPKKVEDLWGKPFRVSMPELFPDVDIKTVLDELRSQHRKNPPPPFDGVLFYIKRLMRSENTKLVIYSAGDPDIVRNTISSSLGLKPEEDIDVYHLPQNRRLSDIDIDLICENPELGEPDGIVIISDTAEDGCAIAGDEKSQFLLIDPNDNSKKTEISDSIRAKTHRFTSTASALEHAIDRVQFDSSNQWVSALETAVRQRKLLVFLGAGVSVESGMPTANELIRKIAGSSGQLDRAFSGLADDPTIYPQLRRIFAAPNTKPNRIHRALALLDAPYYIGTNWDHLLESAFGELYGEKYGQYVGVAYQDGHLPDIVGKRNAYLKIHGDIDAQQTLVNDVKSYVDRLKNPRLLDKFADVLLNTSVVLFVGYSLSDINILSSLLNHTLWEEGAPPERFALLSTRTPIEGKFLRTAGVKVINVGANDNPNVGDNVFGFLARLCDVQDDFATDVQLLSGARSHSAAELFYQALAFYHTSDYHQCLSKIEEIRSAAPDWRQELSIFARFCYLVVKAYDKLELWDDLDSIEELYINDHLKRVQRLMPGPLFEWLRGHHFSALALAALRAGHPDKALKYADQAIAAARLQSQSSRLLLADRRVVRAMIIQYKSQCGDSSLLDSAWDDLLYAKLALERFGKLGQPDEVHFAGRYYGAASFLFISGNGKKSDRAFIDERKTIEYAEMSHGSGNRMPYGVMSGLYCQSVLDWALGRDHLQSSLARLKKQLSSVQVGKTAEWKIRSLIDIHASRSRKINKTIPPSAYAEKHIENLGLENWLKTPIN